MIRSFAGRLPLIDPTAFVAASADVIGDVVLAAQASVWFAAVLRGDINRIEVGRGSNVQDGSVLHVTRAQGVRLGAGVTLGHRVVVHGAEVEDGALVGIGAVVLDGAVIGAGSLVAAGSVVTPRTRVPPRSFVAGVPARVLRPLSDREIEARAARARNYLVYGAAYRQSPAGDGPPTDAS
jgi:carbonic anhydrase/acetyltransferase-like protein (isoleucine patch superfamily)